MLIVVEHFDTFHHYFLTPVYPPLYLTLTFIQNGNLKSELQYLMDQTEQAKETHRMEIVNDIYKKLHDLDYFLLRYGPKDVAKYVEDDSTVSKYYGTLPFY